MVCPIRLASQASLVDSVVLFLRTPFARADTGVWVGIPSASPQGRLFDCVFVRMRGRKLRSGRQRRRVATLFHNRIAQRLRIPTQVKGRLEWATRRYVPSRARCSQALVGNSHRSCGFAWHRSDVGKYCGKVGINRARAFPAVGKSAWVWTIDCVLYETIPCRQLRCADVLQDKAMGLSKCGWIRGGIPYKCAVTRSVPEVEIEVIGIDVGIADQIGRSRDG